MSDKDLRKRAEEVTKRLRGCAGGHEPSGGGSVLWNWNDIVLECLRECFEAGQREAYEDAAKMARAHAHLSSPDCPTSDHTVVDCPEWISNEIRQKANELYDNPVQKGKK